MRRLVGTVVTFAALVPACGNDEAFPVDGASADARVDAATADAANTDCSGNNPYTGELIDFDSTEADFLGVFDAHFSVRGEADCTADTAPNGRFILSLPDSGGITDIDAPTGYLDGIAVVKPQQFLNGGATFSYRDLTTTRATELYTLFSETFDPTKAHVVVNQTADHEGFTLLATHGIVVGSADGSAWAEGDSATYILFTNVDVGTGMTTLTGTATGNSEIPLEAGKITYASRFFVLD
jgi:hypothetical protein